MNQVVCVDVLPVLVDSERLLRIAVDAMYRTSTNMENYQPTEVLTRVHQRLPGSIIIHSEVHESKYSVHLTNELNMLKVEFSLLVGLSMVPDTLISSRDCMLSNETLSAAIQTWLSGKYK